MIINYSTAYIVNALQTMFVFGGNETVPPEPPEPPVEFGKGGGSFVVGGSSRLKLVGGSGGRGPIGGSR